MFEYDRGVRLYVLTRESYLMDTIRIIIIYIEIFF